jgi:hypothetical protein
MVATKKYWNDYVANNILYTQIVSAFDYWKSNFIMLCSSFYWEQPMNATKKHPRVSVSMDNFLRRAAYFVDDRSVEASQSLPGRV